MVRPEQWIERLLVDRDDQEGAVLDRGHRPCCRKGRSRFDRGLERRVLEENRAFQLLQRLARLQPQLVDEQSACLLVSLKRLGLAPAL